MEEIQDQILSGIRIQQRNKRNKKNKSPNRNSGKIYICSKVQNYIAVHLFIFKLFYYQHGLIYNITMNMTEKIRNKRGLLLLSTSSNDKLPGNNTCYYMLAVLTDLPQCKFYFKRKSIFFEN